MNALPIRVRLTAWYALVLAISIGLLGTGLWLGLRYQLEDGFHERTARQFALARASVVWTDGRVGFSPTAGSGLDDDEQFAQVFDGNGHLAADLSRALDPVLPAQEVARVIGGDALDRRLVISGQAFEVAFRPVEGPGGERAVLVTGVSRDDVEETLRYLLVALVIAVPATMACALLGGYAIAGRALAPVEQITSLAAAFDPADHSARIDLTLPDDEIGRLADTFNQMLDRIAGAFDRQRRFTGDASHELRTPLAAMRAEIDLTLSRPRDASEHVAALRRLDGDVKRSTALLDTLLALSRADEGKLLERARMFDAGALAESVAERYVVPAAAAGVGVRCRCEPVSMLGDPELIARLLTNLIDNALAHTPRGGTIEIGVVSNSGETVLWVEDSGRGIAAADLDKVFDRFYRVDAGRSRSVGGTGLGLSLCVAIAQVHGGTLTATSELGRGSRFEARFPQAQA